jgi:hypothetical protein
VSTRSLTALAQSLDQLLLEYLVRGHALWLCEVAYPDLLHLFGAPLLLRGFLRDGSDNLSGLLCYWPRCLLLDLFPVASLGGSLGLFGTAAGEDPGSGKDREYADQDLPPQQTSLPFYHED